VNDKSSEAEKRLNKLLEYMRSVIILLGMAPLFLALLLESSSATVTIVQLLLFAWLVGLAVLFGMHHRYHALIGKWPETPLIVVVALGAQLLLWVIFFL
jgi:hypothetical protein